jgi:hypothetical protein
MSFVVQFGSLCPVPKSRKQSRKHRARPVRPQPERAEPASVASVLLRKAADADLSIPLAVAAMPPLYLHAATADQGTPAGVDECLVLAHAYAELGIEAQVRVASLTVTDVSTGASAEHEAHPLVWLPENYYLIDPAAERYDEIAVYQAGPVIAAARPGAAPGLGIALSVTVSRGYLQITYAIDSQQASAQILDHPDIQAARDTARRHGVNLASEVVWLLASGRAPADTALIPYRRAAALVHAARRMQRHESSGEDVFFRSPAASGPNGGRPVRLYGIPLPDGTPGPALVG